MPSKIIRRIAGESGVFSLLTGLSRTDLQSLMLAVYQDRARQIDVAQIVAKRRQTSLFAASNVDARMLARFDQHAFACAVNFEAIDLAPVCPLGTTYVLGGIDQNNVLTAIRNAEVLGDSTPALAIEAVLRRPGGRSTVRLAATHRVIRMQPFDAPGFTPHFRLFALATAGSVTGSHGFETEHLREHIGFYLNLFRSLNADGFSLQKPLVEISDVAMTQAVLEERGAGGDLRDIIRAHRPEASTQFLHERGIALPSDVVDPASELNLGPDALRARLCAVKTAACDPLSEQFPESTFRFNLARLEGIGYYTGLCLRISAETSAGDRCPIADGGFVDWTARLLQNKKQRLLTSGIGSEFVCRRYFEGK
jgi:hypothetical protein